MWRGWWMEAQVRTMARNAALGRPFLKIALASLALMSGVLAFAPTARATGPTLLYTQPPCASVYAAPSKQSLLITQLLGGTDITATGEGDASGWTHVRIWSGVDGYIPSALLGAQQPEHPREGVCSYPGLPDAEAEDPPADTGPVSLNASGDMLVS